MKSRRVPFVPQMEATECGAACLSMMLAAHRVHVGLPEVRQRCGVSRDGASAWALLRAAESYGFDAEAVRAEPEDLLHVPLPAILHWNFTHFVVLERFTRGGDALVLDPSTGRRVVERSELDRCFTGIALLITPTERVQRTPRRGLSLARYRGLLHEAAAAVALLFGMSLLLEVLALALPAASAFVVDSLAGAGRRGWLLAFAVALGTAVAAQSIVSVTRMVVTIRMQQAFDAVLMRRFVAHLLLLPATFFLQRRPGDLLQRMQGNAALRQLFAGSIIGTLDGLLLIGYAALAFVYGAAPALVLVAFAALRFMLAGLLRPMKERAMAAELNASGIETNVLFEAVTARETIRAAAAEARVAGRWASRFAERLTHDRARRRLDIAGRHATALLNGLATATFYALGATAVLRGSMSLGALTALFVIQSSFAARLESLLAAGAQWQYLSSHLARLDDVLDAQLAPAGSVTLEHTRGAVALRDVVFRYSDEGPPIVNGVSLDVEAGTKAAIVGTIGAGKSTIVQLLSGLLSPCEGRLLLDGVDVAALEPQALHRVLAVVPQELFVFDGTLRDNVTLHGEFTDDEVFRAIEAACLDELVIHLPDGLDTVVGEQGWQLSGGERQRLCLARALVRRPRVLLLDEATSALDAETGARIEASLRALDCTRIVIAHRLQTIADAEQIFVMDAGRVVQRGTFEELAAEEGLFRTLMQREDEWDRLFMRPARMQSAAS